MSTTKVIARNTLFLYVRMFLTMGISLYTSRVVLDVLGVDNFGIYGVVAGFISLISFVNVAMSTATQRYLAFDIGKCDWKRLNETFNATLMIHIGTAVLIVIFAETAGLWLLNEKLSIPDNRRDAARMVYHISVLSTAINITQVPYNALIIVRDRIKDFALISVLEVVLKLAIVYLLLIFDFDKLVLYAFFMLMVILIISTYYKIYCMKHFEEARFKFYFDAEYYGVLLKYSGWHLFGSLSSVAKGHGINVLLNLFFGTVLNAAYTIMMQVQNAVNVFNANFLLVIRPHIIKKYAADEMEEYRNLTIQGSKISFFLMYIIMVPIIFNIDFILNLWLKNPPAFTGIFVVLGLINLLIDSLSGTLMTAVQATGKVKWYQIILGLFLFMNLPVSYLVYSFYRIPELSFYVGMVLSILSLIFRLIFLNHLVGFEIRLYIRKVFLPTLMVSAVAIVIYYLDWLKSPTDFFGLIRNVSTITVVNLLAAFLLGASTQERQLLYRTGGGLLKKIKIKI